MPAWVAFTLFLAVLLVGAAIVLLVLVALSLRGPIDRRVPLPRGEPTELAEALDNDFGKASRR